MDHTCDSRLAAILARGLIRAGQGAGRPDGNRGRGDEESEPTAAKLPGEVHPSGETPAAGNEQGDPS